MVSLGESNGMHVVVVVVVFQYRIIILQVGIPLGRDDGLWEQILAHRQYFALGGLPDLVRSPAWLLLVSPSFSV